MHLRSFASLATLLSCAPIAGGEGGIDAALLARVNAALAEVRASDNWRDIADKYTN